MPATRVAWSLASTAFLSAFLLFQVQPLICKTILPWFGGVPAVWSASMFFFQVALLAGYAYAHALHRFLPVRWQAAVHSLLVIAACVRLPIAPDPAWRPTGTESDPTWLLIGLLTSSVGLPFFVLASTAPLTQVWWHRRFQAPPYKLYAVSNAGSLLALLSYPFVVEPRWGLQVQANLWSALFVVVGGLLVLGSLLGTKVTAAPASEEPQDKPRGRDGLGWLAYSACGSVLLLAMTNQITQNIAVVPFLWILPLAIYLLSFILCYAPGRWYRRRWYGPAMIATQLACAYLYLLDTNRSATFDNSIVLIGVHLAALFCGCMVCHGELARQAPAGTYLTGYFLLVSAGGALGGFLVSLVAPQLFSHYYEYPLVLVACWVLLLLALWRDPQCLLAAGKPRVAWAGITLVSFAFLWLLQIGVVRVAGGSLLAVRNFYGVLALKPYVDKDEGQHMSLVHGVIGHGSQYLDESREHEPTTYYQRESGLGYAMEHVAGRSQKKVGLLGLGVGTAAAYCEAGDTFRAYEINAQVIEIATSGNAFTFWTLLKDRGARGEVVLGDARIQLERERAAGELQNFDVLIVDVFSGDAIPVHLLTTQAMETYLAHLSPQGILAVHVSNRYLKLIPVVKSLAEAHGLSAVFVNDGTSEWVLLGQEQETRALLERHPRKVRGLRKSGKAFLWTDDYSNILRVLR